MAAFNSLFIAMLLKLALVAILLGAFLMFLANLKINKNGNTIGINIKVWFYFLFKLSILTLIIAVSILVARFVYL
jgi:hypothetical protein